MFIAALFKIAKTWKYCKHSSTDEWIKMMLCTHTHTHTHTHSGLLLSHKNETMPFRATWLQLEIIILSKGSQKEKDKYHVISLICGI